MITSIFRLRGRKAASPSTESSGTESVLTPEEQAELARRAYDFHNWGVTR